MKPKSKLEHEIVAVSNSLPAIAHNQHKPAFSKCFSHSAVLSRNTAFCLECGHNWKQEIQIKNQKVTCPHCLKKLEYTNKYSNGLKETDYYQIVTAVKDFQIIRMVCISKTMKKLQKPSYFAHEVMQMFITADGSMRYLSKNVMGLSMYIDQWITSSDLELKSNYNTPRLRLTPSFIQPRIKVLPIIKRNGFCGKFYGIAPQILFREILTDSIAETLIKSNQMDLLYYHLRNTPIKRDGKIWGALKICIRNNYIVNDAKLWVDYLDLLEYYWKDLKSVKYVCPADLRKAHDKLMSRKQKEIMKKTFEENKKQIGKNQKHYLKAKQHFFGLTFSEKNISISVIESVKEFLEEACYHNHCVFTNEYYKKQNSLILSAKVDGIPTETIQLSLENFEILQSRGRGNKASKHNKQIRSVMIRNLHHIQNRMKAA
ncbi:PcfJ domain-containing protein [Flavobacterium phycosphaerae]|uniref:PcfJ domain-containing protein n=1 Tax=Flavobacterium phycosphaerae TaxID=2697515 RepID=UPI00138A4250|nr:PcfJ domain-containing protein [Flavobacterium phycosphaerae]